MHLNIFLLFFAAIIPRVLGANSTIASNGTTIATNSISTHSITQSSTHLSHVSITSAPAKATPTTTFTDTAITIVVPSTSSSSSIPTAIVTNPSDPSQTVAFTKETLPESERSGLPHIDDAAPLALLLLIGGVETMTTITSSFVVVFPLTAASWLTTALYPLAEEIGDEGENNPTASGNSRTSNHASSTHSSTRSSSSNAPTGSPTYYIIQPTEGASSSELSALNTNFTTDFGASNIFSSLASGSINFWVGLITAQKAAQVAKYPGISGVGLDTPVQVDDPGDSSSSRRSYRRKPSQRTAHDDNKSLADRADADGYDNQAAAPNQLALISTPEVQSIPSESLNYYYKSQAGSGITVYVIDTGVQPGAVQGTTIENAIYAGLYGDGKSQTDPDGHGTCVASTIADETFGSAKSVTIVPVKVLSDLANLWPNSALLDGFEKVLADVLAKGIQGKAIINFSWGGGFLSWPGGQTPLQDVITKLIAADVVIVAAAGNDAQKGTPNVNGYPQVWGSSQDIIVVGATDNKGVTAAFSQGGPNVLTWAMGQDIQCRSTSGAATTNSGTSFASPLVAGVVAVMLSDLTFPRTTGQVAAQVKAEIQQLSYTRTGGTNPMVWNGRQQDLLCFAKRDGSSTALGCSKPVSTKASTGSSTHQTSASVSISHITSSFVTSVATTHHSSLPISTSSAPVPTASCPGMSFSNSSNFSWQMAQGSNTFNLHYDATNHPEAFEVGTQWMFAEVQGKIKEWNIIAIPENPTTLSTNTSDIVYEIALNQNITSLTVIGVTIDGLTASSDYWLSLFAYGAPSSECGGHLPQLPAAPPVPPTITTAPTTTTHPANPAQTVTNIADCQVCVLPAGSVDPFCNPIPGCILATSTSSVAAAPTCTPTLECESGDPTLDKRIIGVPGRVECFCVCGTKRTFSANGRC